MKAKMALWIALLLLLPVMALADTHTVENDYLLLTIDDTNLDMTVTDKATGLTLLSGADAGGTGANASWTSFLASSLVLDVSSGTAVTTERVDIHASEVTIDLTMTEDGADVVADFTAIGQRINLRIRLEDDSLAVTIPEDGITEYGQTQLCGLYLLPCMGATHLDEKAGYMLVPEAAGALIDFTDGDGVGSTPFSKRIDGSNVGVDKSVLTDLNRPAEEITLPVYGMAYTDEGLGYLAVVEQGSEAAEIMAYPAGVITEFNWAAAHFTLREQYIAQTTRTQGLNSRESKAYLRDMTMRFYILTGEEASYAGMARRYRAALEAQDALRDADTAYRPRLDFLGAESAQFLLWNSVVPMTTVQQAGSILDTYAEAGLNPPLVIYRGWQPGGLSYSLGSGSTDLEGKLGGKEELAALAERIRNAGGRFLMEIDPVQANTNRMYNMRLDVVRTIGQTVAEILTGKDLYPTYYYLTPKRSAEILADVAEAWSGQTDGLALTGMPNILYSYFSNGNNYSRGSTLRAYEEAMRDAAGKTSLALENPLAGYFSVMDTYLDMPLSTTSYSFLSAEVPFLPIVLSGHVPYYSTWNNFESNQQRQLLKMVEYGAYPSYLLTGEDVQALMNTNSCDVFTAKWDVMMPSVLATDKAMAELHKALQGASMVDHKILAEDVVCVTYDSGARVYVNYRREDARADGRIIPAQGWLVQEGGVAP